VRKQVNVLGAGLSRGYPSSWCQTKRSLWPLADPTLVERQDDMPYRGTDDDEDYQYIHVIFSVEGNIKSYEDG